MSKLPPPPIGFKLFEFAIDAKILKVINSWIPLDCLPEGGNCIPSAFTLTGIVSRFEAELWGEEIKNIDKFKIKTNIAYMLTVMNKIARTTCQIASDPVTGAINFDIHHMFKKFCDELSPNHITMVGILHEKVPIGHMLNLVKMKNGDIFILDGSNEKSDVFTLHEFMEMHPSGYSFIYFWLSKDGKRKLELRDYSEFMMIKKHKKISPPNKKARIHSRSPSLLELQQPMQDQLQLQPIQEQPPFIVPTVEFRMGKKTKTKKGKTKTKTKTKKVKI